MVQGFIHGYGIVVVETRVAFACYNSAKLQTLQVLYSGATIRLTLSSCQR
jgi:hypothetical protein